MIVRQASSSSNSNISRTAAVEPAECRRNRRAKCRAYCDCSTQRSFKVDQRTASRTRHTRRPPSRTVSLRQLSCTRRSRHRRRSIARHIALHGRRNVSAPPTFAPSQYKIEDYCLSNALHSSIGQNIKKSHPVSVVRCPFSGQSVKKFKWP